MSGQIQIEIPSAAVAEFCRRWKIVELSLFGSVLRGDFDADSDVDMLVVFAGDATWSLMDLVGMREEMTKIVGRPTDFVEADGLRNPFRRYEILRTRQVIYAA